MNKFYETPEGKILMHAVHEHSNGLGYAKTCISLIEMYKKNNELTDEKLDEYLKNIKEGIKRAREAMDYVYKNIKQLKGYE